MVELIADIGGLSVGAGGHHPQPGDEDDTRVGVHYHVVGHFVGLEVGAVVVGVLGYAGSDGFYERIISLARLPIDKQR